MPSKKKGKKKTGAAKRVGKASGLLKGLLNPDGPLLTFGPPIAGYFLRKKINPAIDKVTAGKIPGWGLAIGQGGIGFALMQVKAKSPAIKILTKVVGGVVLGAGAGRALSLAGIGGYGDVRAVNGYGDVKAVNGPKRRNQIAGYNPSSNGMGMYAGSGDFLNGALNGSLL